MKRLSQQQRRSGSNRKPGFTTLVAVLVVGAVGTAVVTSLLLLGVGSLQSSLTIQRSSLARYYADTCAEEAMHMLSEDSAYTAGLTITFTEGNCEVLSISGSGDTDRVVQVEGTVGTIVRRVKVDAAEIQPAVILNSWQEVAQF